MHPLPETILQFGGGRFLRAFTDLFVDEANQAGQAVGRVVVVQSTPGNRAALFNAQGGQYHVVIRGLQDGQPVDRVHRVTCVSRGLVAQTEWDAVLAAGRSPDLRLIVSNTTEMGYALDPDDRPGGGTPRSFPARLLLVLSARFESSGAGVTVLPCELIDQNADRLLALVLGLAQAWGMDGAFTAWLQTGVWWLNTLVDRITSGTPAAHPLLAEDGLLTVTEPFAFWAIQEREGVPPLFDHPAIERTQDVRPYALRKVRILNGAHTALVCKALPLGIETVREAVIHPEIGPWLRGLIFEEIVPTLIGQVVDPASFAEQALERFANPFLDHKLVDIAVNHDAKVRLRLIPTYRAFLETFGHRPPRLGEIVQSVVGDR